MNRSTKRERNCLIRSHQGWVEQDMYEVWASVKKAIGALTGEAGQMAQAIAAIGITGQGDGTWLIGRSGEPVRRALTWLDARACEIVKQWQEEGIAHEIFLITGSVPTSSSQSAQLSWLSAHEPEVLRDGVAALYAKDWVFYKMTGEVSSDESDAGHTFFDIQKFEPSHKVMELTGIPQFSHLIPRVRFSYQNIGQLKDDVASELGLRKGIAVVAGPFDIPATALGLALYRDGEVYSIIGTAAIHGMVMDTFLLNPIDVGYTIRFGPDGKWLRVMPTASGTLSLEWFFKVIGLGGDRNHINQRQGPHDKWCFAQDSEIRLPYSFEDDFLYRDIEIRLNAIPPGSEGVIYLPFIEHLGERAPFVNPDVRGEFFGVSITTSRYNLLRAIYEGIALAMKDCYLQMPREFTEAKVAGGGARSPFWMQLMADVTGKILKTAKGIEFGARGAAINAGVATGLFKSFETAMKSMEISWEEFRPTEESFQRYGRIFSLYKELCHALKPLWAKRLNLLAGDSGGNCGNSEG